MRAVVRDCWLEHREYHAVCSAVILMGSNWDADRNLHAATEAFGVCAYVRIERASSAVVSAAVTDSGEVDPDAPEYRNMAVLVHTSLGPLSLRTELRAIEQRLGRERTGTRSRRIPIDLDLVVFDDMVLAQDGLQLPDPAIERHAFAAIPVAQVIPHWTHPIRGISYAQIAARLVVNPSNTRRPQ